MNIDKTKILIFNGNTNDYKKIFTLGNRTIENIKEYKYLGLTFTKLNKFNTTKKLLTQRATKAMYFILSKSKDNNLSIECKLKLFDSVVTPILLYGCEIWGYENTDIIENIHVTFMRRILPLKKSTPLYMLYGELGRKPLKFLIQQKIISFWARIVMGKQTKISFLLHELMLRDQLLNKHNYTWINNIKTILNNLGMSDVWMYRNFQSNKILIEKIKLRQHDQYIQNWNSDTDKSSKGNVYKIFKENLNLEQYFNILPEHIWTNLIKFRTANHYLPIETGRWNNTPLENRLCTLCEMNDIGDEYHYLFICNFFTDQRKHLLKSYYYVKPSILKFNELMNTRRISYLKNTCKLIKEICNKFRRP